MISIHNLPAEIICEIFDKDPRAGLQLANTNKWLSEVLKDKIKKYKQLIRECNVASLCFYDSLCIISAITFANDKDYHSKFKFNSYFICVNCFKSIDISNDIILDFFLTSKSEDVKETGEILCNECTYEYYSNEIDLYYDDVDEDGFSALSIFRK